MEEPNSHAAMEADPHDQTEGQEEEHYTYSEDDDEAGSDDGDADQMADEDEVENDDASEYSYSPSDDDEEVYNNPAPAKAAAAPAMLKPAAPKPKANDPLAELDSILDALRSAFPEAVNREDDAFLRLVTHNEDEKSAPTIEQDHDQPTTKKTKISAFPSHTAAGAAGKEDNAAANVGLSGVGIAAAAIGVAAANATASVSNKTSTGRSGVGYETGRYTASSGILAEKMSGAAKKQKEMDEQYLPLVQRLVKFLADYDGSEGMVLLTLKMSPGCNRLLFSLLKNDSLMEWSKRRELYDATLDLLNTFSESQFYAGFLLHNLLEGDGTPDDGESNCQSLLGILNTKSEIMKRTQKKAFSDGESRDIMEMCERIISTYSKMNDAIANGREVGTIVNPTLELAGRYLGNDDDEEGGEKESAPPTEQKDVATYVKEMKKHRLQHVALVDSVNRGKTGHLHIREATGAAAGASSVKQKRMLRIASEIAGLSADLPIEWASGIFVRVDEDRPDLLKACIMAPEGSPYENGVFEFDIFLPLTYPDNPPKVLLATTDSRSVRFNPNLYNCGKVCLSLLGTWQGPSWIPTTSTLLQVLISIQSLILVPDPYFNEPGYDASSAEQQKRSKLYDRQIRAATLKVAILGQMKKPSPLFADCINDHFRLKKRRILKQLDEWLKLEKDAEAAGEIIRATTRSALTAGGGIAPSTKILQDLRKQITEHIEKTWSDKKKKKTGNN